MPIIERLVERGLNRDFVAKMGIVEEEADETSYWIELLIDADLIKRERVTDLLNETNEILSIVISSIRTARVDGARSVSKSAIRNPQSEIV
ncbi:MAG TPA: four helix bundle protein [Pyrinomonadaceae bacterium]|nr:four helix bundle protein [Pyrinomonadaceae bacterium]